MRNGRKMAMVFQARDDDDAIDQVHQCHRSWRELRASLSALELRRYRPGHFDAALKRWTSTATRLVTVIRIQDQVLTEPEGAAPP